jgi:cytoskeletal protein CcmA (bactofilin family)
MPAPPPPEHRIRPGASFRGLLQLPGSGRIDGHVEGEIVVGGVLWIGPEGVVRARVDAPRIVVEGELHGEVAGAERIELRETARVTADLYTPRLILAEGSFFQGQCSTAIPSQPRGHAPFVAAPRSGRETTPFSS